MAQSIIPVSLSMRRSRYQFLTDMTIVSVVSFAGSGSHRSETRVEKRQDEAALVSVIVDNGKLSPFWGISRVCENDIRATI